MTKKTKNSEVENVKQILKRGRKDPVWFIENVLGSKLWEKQADIVRAVFEHPRVAVRAAHSVGKTYTAARTALAFLLVHPGSRVITTAPTFAQVQRLLWSEIATAYKSATIPLGGELLNTELKMRPDWFAVGLSTDSPDRFQGHHAKDILIILDEATGVDADIWLAAEANRAGGNAKILAIGNPTNPSGPFHACFTSSRDLWHTQVISAFDSPNLIGFTPKMLLEADDSTLEESQIQGLTTRSWVRDRLKEWGEESPLWQSRVLGEFPSQSDDVFFPLHSLETACRRYDTAREDDDDDTLVAGLDLAGPGKDETVLVVRRGNKVVEISATQDTDPRGWIVNRLSSYPPDITVLADEVGIGYHAVSHLKDQGIRVMGVNVGRAASDPKRFFNLRSELLWNLGQSFKNDDIAIPRDDILISQLAGIRYSITPKGQIQAESKQVAAKRGVKSPDRADALMLAFGASPKLLVRPRGRGRTGIIC